LSGSRLSFSKGSLSSQGWYSICQNWTFCIKVYAAEACRGERMVHRWNILEFPLEFKQIIKKLIYSDRLDRYICCSHLLVNSKKKRVSVSLKTLWRLERIMDINSNLNLSWQTLRIHYEMLLTPNLGNSKIQKFWSWSHEKFWPKFWMTISREIIIRHWW